MVGPPFGDVSPEKHRPSDGERRREDASGAQTRRPALAPAREEKSVPSGRGGDTGAPPPERHSSPSLQAQQESGGESEALPPPLLADEDGEESMSASDIFGDLADKQWSFFGVKRA